MGYPATRHRRLRSSAAMRELVRENQISVSDLIYPIFAAEGTGVRHEIESMPGIYHFSLDQLEAEIEEVIRLKIPAVLIFGVPDPKQKDEWGTPAFAQDGIVQRAIRQIKAKHPELIVMADTCLCQFTTHGHCGIVKESDGTACIDNDLSLQYLVKTAVSQAEAGADVIAPSNMMDGFVREIRKGLDEAGYDSIPIMSYAVKYASAFYGPFRDAVSSTPQFGDRKTYQMDPSNVREALREAESDVAEGADMIMVKPALAYMDVIARLKDRFDHPVAAYHVSGEYAMVKAAAARGWIDERAIVTETLVGFKRAGADMILTYYAKDMAHWLSDSL